jgi:predicted permease
LSLSTRSSLQNGYNLLPGNCLKIMNTFFREIKKPVLILWCISAGVMLIALAFLFVFDSRTIFNLSALLSVPHEEKCIMCGMTQSSISISQGDFLSAHHSNSLSLPLFTLIFTNIIAFTVYSITKLRRKYEHS